MKAGGTAFEFSSVGIFFRVFIFFFRWSPFLLVFITKSVLRSFMLVAKGQKYSAAVPFSEPYDSSPSLSEPRRWWHGNLHISSMNVCQCRQCLTNCSSPCASRMCQSLWDACSYRLCSTIFYHHSVVFLFCRKLLSRNFSIVQTKSL